MLSLRDPYVIFSGGMSFEQSGQTPTITVLRGSSTTVLEMEYPVIDFVTICSTPWNSGQYCGLCCVLKFHQLSDKFCTKTYAAVFASIMWHIHLIKVDKHNLNIYTQRGRSHRGACRRRPQFRRCQRCQISMETPLFVCFRTKSDVHPEV